MEEEMKQLQEQVLTADVAPDSISEQVERVARMLGRYSIAVRSDNPLSLPRFLAEYSADPAITVCILSGCLPLLIVLGFHAQAQGSSTTEITSRHTASG